MPRSTLVLRSPCVRAMNSLQTTRNQRKIFFEGRDKVREATGTIIAANRWCTYRTGVARELARNEKGKRIVGRRDYTLSTDKQRLSLNETNSVAVWARATFAGRSNTFCASPRHRRQNHPGRTQRTGAPAFINHWSFLFRAILYQHLWYHSKDRNQSIKYRINAIQ